MKKTLLFAALTTTLLACNNNSDTNSGSNHSNHDTHQNSADTINEMHESMRIMMLQMHSTKQTGNNNVDYATLMLAHHKAAVEMSKLEVVKGNNEEMKAFAQKVIDDQNKEIAMMQDFIAKAPSTASSNSEAFQKALSQSMMAMMKDSLKNYNDIDKDFAAQMIPHHQSAVDMAEAYLQYGSDPSLKTLSQNIVDSQTKEIDWLKQWLDTYGK